MLRIFVVDDNATVRSALRAVLEQQAEWLVVGEAANGRDALKTFYDHRPNLTLMDYSMPEMNGLEAAHHLKERDPSAVILMVTADPTIQLQREARKTGLKGVLPEGQSVLSVNGHRGSGPRPAVFSLQGTGALDGSGSGSMRAPGCSRLVMRHAK